MRYFHTTDSAAVILTAGFRDATSNYLTTLTLTGVFLADGPVDVNQGASGDQVLAVDLSDDVLLGEFELVEEGKPYREWCVPANLINTHGTVQLLTDDELDDL
jgi:hypothetical protein